MIAENGVKPLDLTVRIIGARHLMGNKNRRGLVSPFVEVNISDFSSVVVPEPKVFKRDLLCMVEKKIGIFSNPGLAGSGSPDPLFTQTYDE